jgi:S1-C subfamily serine protease
VDWNDDEQDVDVTSSVAPVMQHKAHVSLLNALFAAVLVVAVGGFGFILGHDVVKPNGGATAQARVAGPNFPSRSSGGSGTGGFGGFGGSFPSISGPGSSGTTHNAAAAKIAKAVDPGLVDIDTNLGYQDGAAAGTGMVLTANGYVLTNNHVIADATSITARDVETGKTYKATVVGYDVTSDVAVLKLTNAKGLTTVSVGNSNDLVKAESVVGIGNAGGVGGTPSYAAGTILALNQSITATDEASSSGAEHLTGLIEVSANIEPGDSGGPLVNSQGQVIGMDTAGSSSSGAFGFEQSSSSSSQAYAIPINEALSIAKSIEKGQGSSTIHVGSTAFLGVEVSNGSSSSSSAGSASTSGVTIQEVIPNTPAAASALAAGDVITTLNGTSVSSTTALADILQTLHAGDSIEVGYVDTSGNAATLTLTLGSGPAQ